MNEYFTRFGAADYNIFHNGNASYVMLRVADEDMTYFALFEHIEGHDGVGCRMFNSPTEVVFDDAVEETCSDEQLNRVGVFLFSYGRGLRLRFCCGCVLCFIPLMLY